MSQRAKLELYFTPDSCTTMLQNELPNVYKQVKENIELSIKPNKIRHDRTVSQTILIYSIKFQYIYQISHLHDRKPEKFRIQFVE
jgi:hypothetical protein